jgi:hypothetical protein
LANCQVDYGIYAVFDVSILAITARIGTQADKSRFLRKVNPSPTSWPNRRLLFSKFQRAYIGLCNLNKSFIKLRSPHGQKNGFTAAMKSQKFLPH